MTLPRLSENNYIILSWASSYGMKHPVTYLDFKTYIATKIALPVWGTTTPAQFTVMVGKGAEMVFWTLL